MSTANEHKWTIGDRVIWPHRERRGHWVTVYSPGVVAAVDEPGLPPGVRVRFDKPVRGYDNCYATHHELLPEPREQSDDQARAAWERGELVPARITMALNLAGLEGPEVDTALGVEEPAVDEWEAGERYPTWEQVLRLAELTGFSPFFFTIQAEPLRPADTSLIYAVSRAERDEMLPERPVMTFQPAAVAATLSGQEHQ